MQACNPGTRGVETGDPGAHWPASLARPSFWFKERFCLNAVKNLLWLHICTQEHMRISLSLPTPLSHTHLLKILKSIPK